MPRHDLIRELKKLHKSLSPALKAAHLSLEKFDSIIAGTGHDDATIEIYLSQLTKLIGPDGSYFKFMEIYGLKEPQWWINMETLGETNLREHQCLRQVAKELRKDWKKFNGVSKKKQAKQDSVPESAATI